MARPRAATLPARVVGSRGWMVWSEVAESNQGPQGRSSLFRSGWG